jgi:hypothetical protein
MQHYQFLADALKDYTKTKRPDQDAAKLLDHLCDSLRHSAVLSSDLEDRRAG